MQDAKNLITKTVDDLKYDSSYLRVRSRDVPDDQDADLLRAAAEQIAQLSQKLERMVRRIND